MHIQYIGSMAKSNRRTGDNSFLYIYTSSSSTWFMSGMQSKQQRSRTGGNPVRRSLCGLSPAQGMRSSGYALGGVHVIGHGHIDQIDFHGFDRSRFGVAAFLRLRRSGGRFGRVGSVRIGRGRGVKEAEVLEDGEVDFSALRHNGPPLGQSETYPACFQRLCFERKFPYP